MIGASINAARVASAGTLKLSSPRPEAGGSGRAHMYSHPPREERRGMKNRIITALAFMSLAVLTTEARAQAPASTGFEPSYGLAGCGLGSMLIGSKPGIVQIFAATTNGSFGTQTFGITSGTSNCGT